MLLPAGVIDEMGLSFLFRAATVLLLLLLLLLLPPPLLLLLTQEYSLGPDSVGEGLLSPGKACGENV